MIIKYNNGSFHNMSYMNTISYTHHPKIGYLLYGEDKIFGCFSIEKIFFGNFSIECLNFMIEFYSVDIDEDKDETNYEFMVCFNCNDVILNTMKCYGSTNL